MKVIIFGASGMVGGGVLRECLEDREIESVLAVGRRGLGLQHPKLRELVRADLFDLGAVAGELEGYDACFYCLGLSSAGMSEADYRRLTFDLTVVAAEALARASPGIKWCFVSGRGTDSSARGRVMWARVKGEAENYLLALPQEAYVFRPGFIQPMKGVRSRTLIYRVVYAVLGPLSPVLRRLFPSAVTTSVNVGRAMIRAVTQGYPKRVLETEDINALAEGA